MASTSRPLSLDAGTRLESYPYTPAEYAAMFLDFYKFLTTLHHAPSDLKIPPPGGWPHLTREAGVSADYKTYHALKVTRHLPYLGGEMHYEHKSIFIDYSSLDPRTSWWFNRELSGYPADDFFTWQTDR
ncbi:hypothetical protein QBC40DRAFT_270039 [Triangularia verruculosa]|uniref:Uncharacterized protein n=1 Tax=Triangularia verruculosa TaxID=2587418 RepID=A0AAN6X6G0_9PEZI|nr:hypothetical protein QBC40DRAFT_270039 [Triangularia verruculosa]